MLTLEVFEFWTFLKSARAQGLYGALDLKNTPLCKKFQKFYHYPIARSGLISMPILLRGPYYSYDVIYIQNCHNLSFKTDRKSKQTLFYFFEGVVDTESANDDVIFSICGGVCTAWDNLSYLELNQLCFIYCSRAM